MNRLVILTLGLAVAAGCGGSSLKTVPVSGVVTLDGRPLPNASVTFSPENPLGMDNPISTGRTAEDGSYTLTVISTGDEGAVIGTHIVRIAMIGEENEDSDVDLNPGTEDSIPDHDLKKEVKKGENTVNIDL